MYALFKLFARMLLLVEDVMYVEEDLPSCLREFMK